MAFRKKAASFLKNNRLLIGIIAAVIIGGIIGVFTHDAVQASVNPSPRRLSMYIKFPGELFIRMLKLIVIPLIISSIIAALCDIDISSAGRLGRRTLIFYITTTFFSSILGLVVASIIKPGSGVYEKDESAKGGSERNSVDSLLDLLRNVFPDNLLAAFTSSTFTTYGQQKGNYRYETQNFSYNNVTAKAFVKLVMDNVLVESTTLSNKTVVITHDVLYNDFGGLKMGGGANMIGLIVCSIVFGVVFNKMGEEGKPLVDIFKSLYGATMKIVQAIMWLAPIGVCSIVAGNLVETNDISLLFRAIGLFVLTNVVGHFIQAVILYPLLYLILIRRNPLMHVKHVLPAVVTAFGTSSSAATLPTTIECCESNAKIDKHVTRFVLPIGATCNMDGAAMYYAIVVLFVEQIEQNLSLDIGEKILAVLISTLVSIGAAGIPSPGLSNLVIILEAVGLPIDKIAAIFAVDWLLDRLQTVVNVLGDTYAAAIVGRFSKDDVEPDKIHIGDYDDEMTNSLTTAF